MSSSFKYPLPPFRYLLKFSLNSASLTYVSSSCILDSKGFFLLTETSFNDASHHKTSIKSSTRLLHNVLSYCHHFSQQNRFSTYWALITFLSACILMFHLFSCCFCQFSLICHRNELVPSEACVVVDQSRRARCRVMTHPTLEFRFFAYNMH